MSGNILHLSTTRLTPEVVLHQTLGNLGNINAVIVLTQDADGRWEIDYSQMAKADLCMAEKWLAIEVAGVVADED